MDTTSIIPLLSDRADGIGLTPTILEVVVRAPMAARAFQPRQFYRLQNYESLAPRIGGATLAMEGLALTGAAVDRGEGLLSTIVLERGGSSDVCALLKPGERPGIGRTGRRAEIGTQFLHWRYLLYGSGNVRHNLPP